MSLQPNLTRPLVILPIDQHTHTVIFLHRFSADTTEDELRSKVLSAKMTRNHKTLAEPVPFRPLGVSLCERPRATLEQPVARG